MWIYWALFLWPALATLAFSEKRTMTLAMKSSMWSFAIILTLVIGLRFEVGVDWGNYLGHLDLAEELTLLEFIERGDPAYWILNWIAAASGAGVWLVNLVCATVFVSGLFVFCRRLPNPWIALMVAMPYMAIVLAMNYTRQSIALGFVLFALVALHDGRLRRFVIFVVIAALFHKTAAVLVFIGAMASTRNRWWTLVWIGFAAMVAYWAFIADSEQTLIEAYITEQMASDGAAIRVAMNAAAGVIFLVTRHRFELAPAERQFWIWMSLIVLLFIPVLWLSPSSTVVDRMGLYFMPIQLIAFSHLIAPNASGWGRQIPSILLVMAYGVVQYVWFNYSNYYWAWLPYKFYPFEVL